MEIVILLAIFVFVAIAAKQIGQLFSRYGLPYITGYLLAGMVAGPFILDILPKNTGADLRFVDELSLAVIAFVAGSELYLKEIRHRLRTISLVTSGVLVSGLLLIGLAIFFLTPFISFTQDLSVTSRLAVAILGGTILLALSPASTIAVMKEVRAKGSFSKTILGITVTMDVVIIIFFAVAVTIAGVLLTGAGFDLIFASVLVIDLSAALLAGYLVGKLLTMILSTNMRFVVKIGLILLAGYGIFVANHWLIDFSKTNLPIEIHLEPLLVAMIAGFFVTNFTPHRDQFARILHDVGPAVYVAFFTLTGVALKLDILLTTLPFAVGLFAVRAGAIALGSNVAGQMAGEPPRFNRYAWMSLITQAGIALGLAREVALEFPTLGDAFATLIISVVVLNEIFGPMFLKYALRQVGEATVPERRPRHEVRNVLILGIEPQSLELARQLQGHNWHVLLADTDRSHVDRLVVEDVSEHFIPTIDEQSVNGLLSDETDAVVAMLSDDRLNLRAMELACKKGVPRLIVRPNDLAHTAEFQEMGALVLDPASAMVGLLDQSVRAPTTTAVLLNQDTGREMVQITINNSDLDGTLLRDVRLPTDVLFMDITRDGHILMPHGYTRLRLNDEVTLIGARDSLEEAVLKLGF